MINQNEPAYPLSKKRSQEWTDNPEYGLGMDIRTKIAAMVLQGLCANPQYRDHNAHWHVNESVHRSELLIEKLNKKEA